MDLEERFSRWIQASIGAGAVDPFFMPTIQGLGRLDCEILAEDERFRSLGQKETESVAESELLTRRFTLSYLWVIGSFENLRTLHQSMKERKHTPAIVQKANRVKAEFVKIRSPLTKMKPSNPHGDATSRIAFPALGPDRGAAWQIGPQIFISRLDLSNLFLEFLEELKGPANR
jgi:hypothetical protein